MVQEKTLEEYIKHCEDICLMIVEAGIVRVSTPYGMLKPESLKESFRYEMLKWAIFLADADSQIESSEREIMERYLKVSISIGDMNILKRRERLAESYLQTIPNIIQYAIKADEEEIFKPDPYENQKAQIMVDTFLFFGRTLMSAYSQPPLEAVKAYGEFENMLLQCLKDHRVYIPEVRRMFKPKEEDRKGKKAEDPQRLNELLQEFDSMIGLQNVKKEIHGLVNLMRVQKMRQERGMQAIEVSMHMVFTGNPGTGKTTVARILAEIYRCMGVLSQGQLVEVDRSGLVKGYVGQTATSVMEVVGRAKGGMLFIDEAYTLVVNKSEGDFGQEAVDTLLKAMEDNRDDLVIIVAGYPDLMKKFLESNPGLKSRFNKFIAFDDYSSGEQVQILDGMCKAKDYCMSDDARAFSLEFFGLRQQQLGQKNANARDVRNYFEKAVSNHAARIVEMSNLTEQDLVTIQKVDVESIIID